MTRSPENHFTVKVYHGYGYEHSLVVYGHVLAGHYFIRKKYTNNIFLNVLHLFRLFFITPVPGKKVLLQWQHQQMEAFTESDGFFKFEWSSETAVAAGWHQVKVFLLNEQEEKISTGEGKIFVPHKTQHAFISDIDDTVLVSHSARTRKKLRVLFTKNPHSRKAFTDVAEHYRLLAKANTDEAVLNPFFYVSSSEWNLYNDLEDFFTYNGLPPGVFLLNQIKRWYELLKTGNTKHQGKLTRILRIMEVFPNQRFVLLGDNSQKDPEIYSAVANKFGERIDAIYIRIINKKKQPVTEELIASITNKNINVCLFENDSDAILYSKSIGLIQP